MKHYLSILFVALWLGVIGFAFDAFGIDPDTYENEGADHSVYQNIRCGNVSYEVCVEKIDAFVPREVIDTIPEVERLFLESSLRSEASPYFGPNCHWAAMAYLLPQEFGDPRFVNYPEYEDILESHAFARIETGEVPLVGDLVIIHERADVIFRDRDPDTQRETEWILPDQQRPLHSAVYLGDGIIFQKENYRDAVFSLSTVESVFHAYEDQFSHAHHGRIRVSLEVVFLRQALLSYVPR